MTDVSPWQVWLMNLNPQVGSEQWGTRPVIIVGSAIMCEVMDRLALIVPCTTTHRDLSWQPKLMLREPSVAMCDQVKSLSRDRLVRILPHVVPVETRDEIRLHLARLIA